MLTHAALATADTFPAPPCPVLSALSALRAASVRVWREDVVDAAEKFASAMYELDLYGDASRPWDGSDQLDEYRESVRKAGAWLCALVYGNAPDDVTVDEEDAEQMAAVAFIVLDRTVEVSGWLS